MRRLALGLVLLATLAPACKREKRRAESTSARAGEVPEREPRFLFRRKIEGQWRPFVESASGGDAVPVLSELVGDLYSVAGLEQGSESMFAIVRQTGQKTGALWRLTTQPIPRAAEELGPTSASLFGVSADGGVILLLSSDGKDRESVHLVRRGNVAGATRLVEVRKTLSGDVSADGKHAVLAAMPVSCTESWIGKCPIHLWELDFGSEEPGVRVSEAPATRASYQPRFLPGDSAVYGFESTVGDPDEVACARGLNDCRHDMVERIFGTDQRRVLRENALGPYYSQRGDAAVYMTLEGTGCTKVPCDKLTMVLAERGADGKLERARPLVEREVYAFAPRWWSPDGRFLAYRATGDGKTRPLTIVSVDGKLRRVVAGEHPIGWLR